MSVSPATKTRSRNAAATRQAILDAARRHFARDSYECVGLREIAGDVGVDPALISRYFGGKEELFREVMRDESSGTLFDGVTADELAGHLVTLILDGRRDCENAAAHLDRLLIVLRSATSPKASAIVYEAIDEIILAPIAARIDAPDARLRAGLTLTVLMGSGMVRNVMRLKSISLTEENALRARLTALFETALSAG
ncbi:MAG TPA: TetR family transcriptional regulator [Sphingobium sp.]|nr:TetR family transcriptional regulator [Sphingobium sp.]